MKDFLYKLNIMKNHNKIISLEKKNQENVDKTKELVDSYKEIINNYDIKNQKEIQKMNEKIKLLEEENCNIVLQCKFYKDCLDKIPNFILRIFVGKNRKLLSK